MIAASKRADLTSYIRICRLICGKQQVTRVLGKDLLQANCAGALSVASSDSVSYSASLPAYSYVPGNAMGMSSSLVWLVRRTKMTAVLPRCLETVITTRQYHVNAICETKELNETLKQQIPHSLRFTRRNKILF